MRLVDGRRKITAIHEITGMEGEVIAMQELFGFRQTGVAPTGEVQGYFQASGVRPKFAERLLAFGVVLPDTMFDPAKRYQ